METGSTLSGRRGAWQGFFGRRIMLFIILFLVEVVVFFVLPTVPFASGEQDSYTQQARQLPGLLQNKTFVSQVSEIFTNNLRVGLIEIIPVVGPFFFGLSLYVTARVTQAIALTQNVPPTFLVLTLFLLPHSYLELPAYALATGESLLLLNSLLRRLVKHEKARLRMEMEQFAIVVVSVAVTLFVASVFEVTEIQIGLAGLLMWAPFGVVAATVLLFRRRVLRGRSTPEPPPFASGPVAGNAYRGNGERPPACPNLGRVAETQ